MLLQTERGDAVNQGICLVTNLNEQFQRSLEAATTPWPYNCLSFIPIWLRVVLAVLMGGFVIKLLGEPVSIIFSAARDSALSWSHVFTVLLCPKHTTLRLTKEHQKMNKERESINLIEEGGFERVTEILNDLEARVEKLEEQKKPKSQIKGLVRKDSIVTSLGGTGRARRI